MTLYTVGHGNLSGGAFLRLLEASRIERLIDVRAYPGSRRHPQFSRAVLESACAAAGFEYIWEGKALGGKRRPRADSPHTALDPDVRGFADHMGTAVFERAAARLIGLAAERRTVIMCAEKLPAHCHRFLISDALSMSGATVIHLVEGHPPARHVLSSRARVQGASLFYDCGCQLPLL